MIIREAVLSDLAPVVALLHEDVIREVDESQVAPEEYAAAFDEITRDGHQQLLVGEVGAEVVATAQVTWVRHLTYRGGLICGVESVRVRRDLRGRGLGRQLMEHVVETARLREAARVQLTTNVRRVRARAFYEDLGFVPSHVGMKLHLGQE